MQPLFTDGHPPDRFNPILLKIINNATNELEAREYIDRLFDLIGDNVYYEIMLKQGITPDIINSYFVDKYNKNYM